MMFSHLHYFNLLSFVFVSLELILTTAARMIAVKLDFDLVTILYSESPNGWPFFLQGVCPPASPLLVCLWIYLRLLLVHSTLVTQWPPCKCYNTPRHINISRLLYLLFPVPGMFFPLISTCLTSSPHLAHWSNIASVITVPYACSQKGRSLQRSPRGPYGSLAEGWAKGETPLRLSTEGLLWSWEWNSSAGRLWVSILAMLTPSSHLVFLNIWCKTRKAMP